MPIVFPSRSYSGLDQFHAFSFPKTRSLEESHLIDAMMKDALQMTAKVLEGALEANARARDSVSDSQRPNVAMRDYLTGIIPKALQERLTDALRETRRLPNVTEEHFRVLLMGRTQAGKSTLLEVLTEGDGSRVGDGRQRYTRDVVERPIAGMPGVVLVDTPGVGARDGAEDFTLAFEQIADADLVLWVGNDNPGQEETIRALQLIALCGKPILVVLNCHRDLQHAHKYADFVSDPDWAFGLVDEHFAWTAERLAESGHRPVGQYAVHADAALRAARASSTEADALRRHSRVEALVAAIDFERVRRSGSRRAIRKANLARQPLELARLQLLTLTGQLLTMADLQRRQLSDLEARIERVIAKHGEALNARTRALIGSRRTWHLGAPADRTVEETWREESERLREELQTTITGGFESLQSEIEDTLSRVDKEWSTIPHVDGFQGLPDFGSVWLNRLGRIVLGGGGSLVGGVIGGLVGSSLGPGGTALGAVLGAALLGGVGDWLADKWERLFHSRDEVEKRRRDRIGNQVQELLDKFQSTVDGVVDDGLKHVSDRIQQAVEDQRVQLEGPQALAREFHMKASDLLEWREALDKATVQELLVTADRSSTAESVRRAWRLPGIAICATVDPEAFAEVALFGADSAERIAVLPDEPKGLSATSAAQLMIGLTDAEFVLEHLDHGVATMRLSGFSSHAAELKTLSAFMTEVLGGEIVVGLPTGAQDDAEEEGHEEEGAAA